SIRLQQVAFSSFYPIRRRVGLPRCTTMNRQPSPSQSRINCPSAISTTTSSTSSSNPPVPTAESEPNPNPNPNLKPKSSNPKTKQKQKQKHPRRREFNFSAYPTRKIAFKFSYAGSGYGGLAWQTGPTPLPTVEGELFAALAKARLVDPEGGLEGCGWERCGRTDRGVSAAGQVISLYVRCSNRPSLSLSSSPSVTVEEETSAGRKGGCLTAENGSDASPTLQQTVTPESSSSLTTGNRGRTSAEQQTSSKDRLRYLHTLNAILPPSIRVYAWAPVAPAFSARFSCRVRHYKYFFSAARNLDIDAMRNAAGRLVGEHDFRNLCKLDPAKQITSFRRRILRADISPLNDDHNNNNTAGLGGGGDMHVLDLVGTAFLYNQVRHIMAVLLLIGARLESPSVISALLNVDPNSNNAGGEEDYREEEPPVVTCKPEYQMADPLPLVLWDCVYAPEDAPWRTDDADIDGSEGSAGLHSQLTGLAERAQIEATLAEHFLTVASQFHAPPPGLLGQPAAGERGPWDVPLGGGMARREGRYVPLLKRKRLESVEVVNTRWRTRKDRLFSDST
ncbi:pseudouridine synthase, partial [Russula aff. rugulosa BPL654]